MTKYRVGTAAEERSFAKAIGELARSKEMAHLESRNDLEGDLSVSGEP
jgi:hypothetical protein